MKRVEDWKARLIDLSRKNNLLYFRKEKHGNLPITQPDPQKIFDTLVVKKGQLEFFSLPQTPKAQKAKTEQKSKAKGKKASGKATAQKVQLEVRTAPAHPETATIEEAPKKPGANQLVSDKLTPQELDRALRALERRALLDYRERGVRILYAAFGILNWVDAETKEKVQSPLILVPLELGKETIRAPYSITVPPVEDEAVLNPALIAKLKNDYKIDLPALPEEGDELTLTHYYKQVEGTLSEIGWKTEASVALGLFSFQKLVIYKDLESNADLVTMHPIIRAIAGIKEDNLIQTDLPEEKDVDKVELPAKTYQVLDADSSQRLSIEYALRGQSFVMKGPPGTGKSQTIANIIAECIANGKSVLFVSEKMAALEVVYKRLSEVGLAHFCLEMHSSKANKQQVVAELKRSLDETLVPRKLPSNHEFERLTEYRDALNDYVTALHKQRPYLHCSVYEVLSIICGLERVPFVPVGMTEVGTLTPQKIRELEELTSQLSKVWQVVEEPDFPWLGYHANKYNLEIRSEVRTALEAINGTLHDLKFEIEAFSAKIGVFPPESFTRIQWLLDVSKLLFESPRPEVHWLTNPALDKLLTEAKAYLEITNWIKMTRADLMQRYTPALFEAELTRSQEIEQATNNFAQVIGTADLHENGLLAKRDAFLVYLKNTETVFKKWRETSHSLTQMLGLDNNGLTLIQLKHLARIAQLCFADKPEPQWFDEDYLLQVKETAAKARQLYQDHNLLKSHLDETYTDGIYQLNLEDLITKYSGPYQKFNFFNSEYRNDQKRIAQVTHDGKVPKTVLQDLTDAHRVNKYAKKIAESAEVVQTMLGHFYHKSRTDFNGAEKAIALVEEITKINWTPTIPETLIKLLTTTANPSPMIKNLGEELREAVIKWEQQNKDFQMLLPEKVPQSRTAITETPLPQLEDWITETEKQLTTLCNVTKQTLTAVAKNEPKNYKQFILDLKNSEEIRKKEAQIVGEKAQLQEKYGKHFQESETNWETIVSILSWARKVQLAFNDIPVPQAYAEIATKGPDASPSNSELTQKRTAALNALSEFEKRFDSEMRYQDQPLKTLEIRIIEERIQMLRDRVDDLQIWIDYKDTKNRFTLRGLDGFFNRLAEEKLPANDLLLTFRKSVYQEWINDLCTEDQKIGRFRRENHEQLITDFKTLDQEMIHLTSAMVIDAANVRKPQDILIQAADAEAGILNKEAAKKRRLMPLRMLFQKVPNLLVKLKPCLLMSPMSVSQFLHPDMKFDLVLFDEASQLVPEDAISAIYRGRTIVVAGDNKQLPPTSFFQKNLLDDKDWDDLTDEDIEVFDSILDECLGIGLPVKTLKWHYRSRHEGLIAFSNHRFYDDAMITFPSAKAETDSLGVKLAYVVDGIYDRGGKRANPLEAEKVADLVFEHFKNYPKKTLGVVTFSIAQMEAVQEAIDHRLKTHHEFEHFFKEDRIDGFFVKNLENVQGDERDVIFFSVGYGFDHNHQMTMNFGPLNKPGGERRLNVAVTRAREKVVLITSIKGSDIDPDAQALGVQTLRTYLNYAEHGTDWIKPNKTGTYDSALVEDVAAEIKNMGYQIVPEVGCSGYRIDLAVVDPTSKGSYLVGVECDGTTYKSSSSARDRDRLREQILRQLGWRIHRIWAPAWIARRDSEIRRLKEAIEQAQVQQIEKDSQKPITAPATDIQKNEYGGIEKLSIPYKVHPLKATYNPYIKAITAKSVVDSRVRNEFHFPENRENQTKLLCDLIANEGPIHFDYAVERLAATWNIKQVTPKISHAVKEALNNLIREQKVTIKGSFLWPVGLKETPIRGPMLGVPESRRKPQYIPPEEVEATMTKVAQYALGISDDALISETAKVFGISHSNEDTKQAFAEILKRLLRERKLICRDDGVITVA